MSSLPAVRFFLFINQSWHEGTNVPPIFKIALKNYFTSIQSDQVIETENPRSLGI